MKKNLIVSVFLCMLLCLVGCGVSEGPVQTTPEGPACTVSISCVTVLDNMDLLEEQKKPLVPDDGWLLKETTVPLAEGESAFDVLLKVCQDNKIHMEYMDSPIYNSA